MECQYTQSEATAAAGPSTYEVPQAQRQIQRLAIDEFAGNEFCDASIYTRKGIFMQFINTNCIGATTIIGGKRLNLADISRLPIYLAKHKETIKVHAMHLLLRHFQDSQCSTGVGEILSTQDFGMTFSIATISGRAAALNPMGRHEGPVFYSACPDWTEEIPVETTEEGVQDAAQVVNCYIYLPEPNRRRHLVIKRVAEERSRLELTHEGNPSKKQRMNNTNTDRRPYNNRLMIQQENTLGEIKSVQESVSTLAQEVRQLRLPAYPRLPEKSISWPPADSLPDLPDDV
jgi:hypothetical protein